jgi:hypothetical protein
MKGIKYMWKYKGAEMGLEGIVGVQNRDMTDEEFREANAKIGLQFPGQPNSLVNCGLWEYIDDSPKKEESRRFDRHARVEEEKEVE